MHFMHGSRRRKMKHPVIRNSSNEPTRKANMVSGSSSFVTKINLTPKITNTDPQ
jgi:hypothetical protein